MQLDRLDHGILDLVQEDCSRSHADLGAKIGLSGSAVRRRIQAMRDAKVIAKEVALLGEGAEAYGISVIVTVTFERETPQTYDSFRAAMRSDDRVLQCYATAGQFDFILVVAAKSPEDYEAWGERTLLNNLALRRYDSFVVWSTVKFTTKRPSFNPGERT